MEMRPILILGAMDTEIEYLISKIENCKKIEKSVYTFYEGIINDYPVVLVKTLIGIVNASSSTTLAIEMYNPRLILNEGTAGGIIENRHKKDIIIAKEVFNNNSYKTPYRELGEGTNPLDWDLVTFISGEKDIKRIYESNKKLAEVAYSVRDTYKNGNVYYGVVGSGDSWNCEKDRLKYFADVHNVSCEDMESVAIYSVAKNYNLPVLAIKIMSDNELLGEEYEPKVGLYCQEYCLEVIKKIIENIDNI